MYGYKAYFDPVERRAARPLLELLQCEPTRILDNRLRLLAVVHAQTVQNLRV